MQLLRCLINQNPFLGFGREYTYVDIYIYTVAEMNMLNLRFAEMNRCLVIVPWVHNLCARFRS